MSLNSNYKIWVTLPSVKGFFKLHIKHESLQNFKMTRYTFLVPVYKGKYLDHMLQSIKDQTFTNFKVIISDDCSPENIKQTCEQYLKDSRFSYRRNKKNIGGHSLIEHWNMLINMCDTEYLIMASDDDVYNIRFLEEVDRLANKYKKVDLIRARTCRINEDGELYAKDPCYEEYENSIEFYSNSFNYGRIHCIGNYVFKTQSLIKIHGFVNFPLAWYSDDATVLSCGLNGVANTSAILFCFRTSPYNISNDKKIDRATAKKKINATCSFYEWMKNFTEHISVPSTLYYTNLYESFHNNYKQRVIWQIYTYYLQLDFNSLVSLMKWMRKNKLFMSKRTMFSFIKSWIIIQIKYSYLTR